MKVFRLLLLVLSVLTCALIVASSRSNSIAWRHFKQQHGKAYESQEEEVRRFGIFMANKQSVDRHNANASASYKMSLNHMADWTAEEYDQLNGVKLTDTKLDFIADQELDQILGPARDAPLPKNFDWRRHEGRVSDVKNQYYCGSCWAFATTGLLEGCSGGWMSDALDDIANRIGGIESEEDYPYWGADKCCCSHPDEFLPLKVEGYKMLPPKDEATLKKTLVKYGPIAVAFDATQDFKFYESGIFEDDRCKSSHPNHAVLVVGYGKDHQKGDFWIVKNSWGTQWGEKGYFRIKAGKNMCGIADFGTIATF